MTLARKAMLTLKPASTLNTITINAAENHRSEAQEAKKEDDCEYDWAL